MCQHTSFMAAWYITTGAWYALVYVWLALFLWPSRLRAGHAIGTVLLFGVLTVTGVLFRQTFHCRIVGADGHADPDKPPYENRRAFPSIEGALLAYAVTQFVLHPGTLVRWQLTQNYQRTIGAALVLVYLAGLLWFHTPTQVALSLLLGAAMGAVWQRVLQRVLAEFPGAGGGISSSGGGGGNGGSGGGGGNAAADLNV